MENSNNLILIDEKDREDAKALTQSFARDDVKSRAYINALGAELCIKYFKSEQISDETSYNIHCIRKFLEEFDISDVMLSNIHVDVRVITDENKIFVPISHFKYNITPDVYIVLKMLEDKSGAELLGYFEPKTVNKTAKNDKYYFVEKEDLSAPSTLKDFIANFSGRSTDRELTEEIVQKAEFLMVSMADNNAGEAEKKELFSYLKNSAELRNKFIEFENGEMLFYKAANEIGLKDNDGEGSRVQAVWEENAKDLSELNIEDIAGVTDEILSGNGDNGDRVPATIGAGVAGAAAVSAALVQNGAGEGLASGIGSTIAAGQDALNLASELAGNILNSANNNNPSPANSSDFDFGESDLSSTFEAFQDGSSDFSQGSDELIFENNDDYSSDDLVFENNDDYGDEIIFENNDDNDYYGEPAPKTGSGSSTSPAGGPPRIAATMNTPISEATELVSLDAIKGNMLPPENKAFVNFEEQENLISNAQFKQFVEDVGEKPVAPTDESVVSALDFNNVKSAPKTNDNENVSDMLPKLDGIDEDSFDIPENSGQDATMNLDEIPLSDVPLPDNMTNDFKSTDFAKDISEITVEPPIKQDVKPENTVSEEVSNLDFNSIKDLSEETSCAGNEVADIPQSTMQDEPEITEEYRKEGEPPANFDSLPNQEIDEAAAAEIVDVAERELFGTKSSSELSDEDSIPALEPSEGIFPSENTPPASTVFEDPIPTISEDYHESPELSLIYNDNATNTVENAVLGESLDYDATENYSFTSKPAVDMKKIAPLVAAVVVIVLGVSIVGLLGSRHKNSVANADDTLLQTSPDNEAVMPSPEVGNPDAMNEGMIPPATPPSDADTTGTLSTMEDQASQAAQMNKDARQAAVQDMKNSINQQQQQAKSSQKPITRSNVATIKNISWSVPDYLSYSDNIKKYLQTAGKSIKLSLSSDLLLTDDYIYSNKVSVALKMSKDGTIQSSSIVKSSGSEQVDNLVLQNIKSTLNVIKPPSGEVPTPTFKLGLTISL